MIKVKTFAGIDIDKIEEKINEWLETDTKEIVNICATQSTVDNGMQVWPYRTVFIFYKLPI